MTYADSGRSPRHSGRGCSWATTTRPPKRAADPDGVGTVTATFDDPWAIMYTSGTTGHPKGAIVTHGMFFWNAINIGHAVGLTSKSTNLNVLPDVPHRRPQPVHHAVSPPRGAVDQHGRVRPGAVLRYLESGEITHFFGVPAIYQFLAEHPRWLDADLSKVESWACGGAPMPVALLKRYADRGVVIRQGMGLTETSPTVFLTDEAHAISKVGSVGKPALHTEIRVVDEAGDDVGTDEVGELWVRGPNVTPGYWERPDANADSFTDGWLHTGDAARIDADGYVFIVDRWKDMYISGGENVYPAEVEQVLFHHPNVLDVAVIGVPDERWGEVGMAVVVPREADSLDEDDLIAFCADKLAKYKIPKLVTAIDELPRNAAGKVLKRELAGTADVSGLVNTYRTPPMATVELNRPERHNSLVPELLRELLDVLNAVGKRPRDPSGRPGCGRQVLLDRWGCAWLLHGRRPARRLCLGNGGVAERGHSDLDALSTACGCGGSWDRHRRLARLGARRGRRPDGAGGNDHALVLGGWLLPRRRVDRDPAQHHRQAACRQNPSAQRDHHGRAGGCLGLGDRCCDDGAASGQQSWRPRLQTMKAGSVTSAKRLLHRDHDQVASALEAERAAFMAQILTPEAHDGMASFLGAAQ